MDLEEVADLLAAAEGLAEAEEASEAVAPEAENMKVVAGSNLPAIFSFRIKA